MTCSARSYLACEPRVRSRKAARSRSVNSRTRPRSMAGVVIAMRPRLAPPSGMTAGLWTDGSNGLRRGRHLVRVVVAVLLGPEHPPAVAEQRRHAGAEQPGD